jgi:hypothetical protein
MSDEQIDQPASRKQCSPPKATYRLEATTTPVWPLPVAMDRAPTLSKPAQAFVGYRHDVPSQLIVG